MRCLNKTYNEYAEQIDPVVYSACPKAVFAAIAVSRSINDGDAAGQSPTQAILDEWGKLFAAGIVPQKPPPP